MLLEAYVLYTVSYIQAVPKNFCTFVGRSFHFSIIPTIMPQVILLDVFKAILRDVMGEENFTFHCFSSYIYVMTLVVTVL